MSGTDSRSDAEREAYTAERAFWLGVADSHFDEADLPFIRWHQEQVRDRLAIPRDQLVAEVGCGAGKLLGEFPRVLLIDFSPEILARARAMFPHAFAVCASIDALPFRDGALGHVVANNMLHHVKGEGLLDAAVDELARAIGPAGRFYINDRNPAVVHHAIIVISNLAKRVLRAGFGAFPGCGSFNEPLFTRRDWKRIGRRFEFLSSGHYYTAAMWLTDSIAKGLYVLLRRRDRGFVARLQRLGLPMLLWLEHRLAWRPICIERAVVARPRQPRP